MSDLEFCTTEELIEELTNRTTFVGVVVYSADQHLEPGQYHRDFKVLSTVGSEEAMSVLEKAIESLESGGP